MGHHVSRTNSSFSRRPLAICPRRADEQSHSVIPPSAGAPPVHRHSPPPERNTPVEVTDVEVRIHEDRQLRGFARVVLDNEFSVGGIRIIEGERGLFLAMPNRRRRDGQRVDVCFPITREMRAKLEAAVLDFYAQIIAQEATDYPLAYPARTVR